MKVKLQITGTDSTRLIKYIFDKVCRRFTFTKRTKGGDKEVWVRSIVMFLVERFYVEN